MDGWMDGWMHCSCYWLLILQFNFGVNRGVELIAATFLQFPKFSAIFLHELEMEGENSSSHSLHISQGNLVLFLVFIFSFLAFFKRFSPKTNKIMKFSKSLPAEVHFFPKIAISTVFPQFFRRSLVSSPPGEYVSTALFSRWTHYRKLFFFWQTFWQTAISFVVVKLVQLCVIRGGLNQLLSAWELVESHADDGLGATGWLRDVAGALGLTRRRGGWPEPLPRSGRWGHMRFVVCILFFLRDFPFLLVYMFSILRHFPPF